MSSDQPGSERKPVTHGGQVKAPRADALRNREKLMATAAKVFPAQGTNASLEDIARQSGVGIGTLYRHFPTREHLVEAVYRRELESLAAAAEHLAATRPADVALEEWMARFVLYIAAKRGMAESLKALMSANSDLFTEGTSRIREAMEGLRAKASAEGLIRSDMDTTDLLHALSGIYSMSDLPDWKPRAHRLIGLLMDGLRTRA
ncbi:MULTISPECIES: TetR/AcrR family transcriptional regulator [unclassified Rhizobium]|uniref:TetR/AcrR family transcriptional regulator n=1 Tax=unclassified Rhizobium TaxID=2613769 RepID=UPI003D2CBDE2